MRHAKLARTAVGVFAVGVFFISWLPAPDAVAQTLAPVGAPEFDRVRVNGFFWGSDINGKVFVPGIEDVPGLEDGIPVREFLGLDTTGYGWLVDGDIGVARRHRILFSFSGVGHSGINEVRIPIDGAADFVIDTDSRVSLRDVHTAYNFLISTREWLDAGVIVGIGHFDNELSIASTVVTRDAEFSSPYPLFGGNLTLKSEDILSIYAEITGFPSVQVGDQSGWQMAVKLRFVVYPTHNIGILAGYERYQLSLDDAGQDVGVNLAWDGFVVGGQFRY